MGRLITLGITSLDGYVADAEGSFAWAEPDEELHRYCNALEAAIRINLYGRLTYEPMTSWAEPPADAREVELDRTPRRRLHHRVVQRLIRASGNTLDISQHFPQPAATS